MRSLGKKEPFKEVNQRPIRGIECKIKDFYANGKSKIHATAVAQNINAIGNNRFN